MPELPDVEKHRRTVADHAAGATVRRVEVADPELLDGTTPQGLGRAAVGRVVAAPRRHGKWLLLGFEDGGPTLVCHFRMTGELVWRDEPTARADGDALTLRFDHGSLSYRTRRRLGGVSYVRAGRDVEEVTGPLGPDADRVDRRRFEELVAGRRGGCKATLMDQRVIAGLGNELVDEILWRSRVHPARPVADLEPDEVADVHRQLRTVLRRSIRAGHVPSGPTWLNGERDEDEPRCPRCGTALRRGQVAGRTTFWCPRDQTAP